MIPEKQFRVWFSGMRFKRVKNSLIFCLIERLQKAYHDAWGWRWLWAGAG